MNFIEILKAIFSALFGGKKAEATTTENSNAEQTGNNNNVSGTQMRQSVFNVMVAGETDAAQIERIKQQMQEKDALGSYPYTISSENWTYTITKPAEPYFSQYGTQYSATQKHK